jgi:transposase InsO family protein
MVQRLTLRVRFDFYNSTADQPKIGIVSNCANIVNGRGGSHASAQIRAVPNHFTEGNRHPCRVRPDQRQAAWRAQRSISGKRVARLTRVNAIRGVSRRRSFFVTTQRDQRQRPAPDLTSKHEFVADSNQLWVADMTYVPT